MTFARTKIQPPRPRPGFVPRGAVQARLAQALAARKLVLLSAPAGYGKTTLLAEAIASLPGGSVAAWVSADAGDDLHRLLECLVAALEPFDPPWRTAPEALVAGASRGAPDEQRRVAAELVNALDACDVTHGTIVFDDVHRIDDPAFFRFLDLALERMASRWTVALTSREDPPLALARLRARNELAEFRQLQLRFARDEARQLAQIAGLDAALADRLFERTQGWPAGLRIAAETVGASGSSGVERALHAVERPMFDFLVSEVLGQLKPELARFLLVTSVLPELDVERCRALTGDEHAARLVDEIERLGLFVDEFDAPARTLRLHDLFREALQQQLRLDAPQRLAELRVLAAQTEPDPIRRIGFLIDAGRLEEAAELVFVHAPGRMPATGPASAEYLLVQFPQPFRDRSPELTYVRALTAYLRWEFGAMFEALERAEGGFAARGERDRALQARALRANALISLGRMDEAERLLDGMRNEPLSLAVRIVAHYARSWLALDTGRGYAVAAIADEMLTLLEEAGRPDLWYLTTPPNRFPGLRGMARPLARHAELLLRIAGDDPTPLRAIGILCQGWCALLQGRLAEARELEERARADAEWTGYTGAVRGHLLALGSFGRAIVGDSVVAIDLARERVGALQGGYREWGRYVLWFFAARVAAMCGDVATLREALQRIDAARLQLGVTGTPERTRMVIPLVAQLAWLEGRTDDAIALWREALVHEEAIDVLAQAAEVRVRLARALLRGRDVAAAAAALVPAFERADAEGGPGGALFAPDALRELSRAAWQGRLPASRLAQLADWMNCIDSAAAACGPAAPPAPPAEHGGGPLTARELEILHRIASGDSNKLVARALNLSLHTVKRHVANILGKLDVDTRGQAADWYRSRT